MPTPTFDLKRYLTKLAAGEPVAAPSGSGKQMFIVGNRLGNRNSQVPTVTPPAESLSKSLPAPAVKPLTSPLAKAPPKTSFKLPRTKFPSPFKVAGFELNMPVAWKPPSIAAAEASLLQASTCTPSVST